MSLHDDIVELLGRTGPLELEFIRARLCVASESRMRAALFMLVEEGRIERIGDGGPAYRIRGDARVPGAGDLIGQWKQKH